MTNTQRMVSCSHPPISKNSPAPSGYAGWLYVDGSCPKNPGKMGIGVVLSIQNGDGAAGGNEIVEFGYQLGEGTNNEAEYLAMIFGMREAIRRGCTTLSVRSDSQLIVNQLNGIYTCNSKLKRLFEEAEALSCMVPFCDIGFIPREENTEADYLSRTPTEPALPSSGAVEIDLNKGRCRQRQLSRRQAAMVRWWWTKNICRNEYRLVRLFGGTESNLGKIGKGEAYRDLTENDLIWSRGAAVEIRV